MAVQGKPDGTMISVEKGRWVWHEGKGELHFQRQSGKARTKPQFWLPIITPKLSSTEDETGSELITLEDVKRVAVKLIGEDTLKRARAKTCELFDGCYRTKQLNDLLWCTAVYYHSYREHKRALSDKKVSMEGSMGESARETLKESKKQLVQNLVNLGEVYSEFILGLGHAESHHLNGGRSRVSKTQTDREFFEVLYEFMLFVVWIIFDHKDWEIIHEELGRLFRTSQFNRDIKMDTFERDRLPAVEGLGRISKTSDQFLSYKVLYERPFVGMLNKLHTQAHKSFLPEPRDKHSWASDTSREATKEEARVLPSAWSPPERLGIIGDPKARYDLETLRCLEGESASVVDSDGESGDEEESQVSDIIEDDGEDSDSF